MLEILRTLGGLCLIALLIAWIVDVARGRTTVRAAFVDEHGPRPVWAALLAFAALATVAFAIALIAG